MLGTKLVFLALLGFLSSSGAIPFQGSSVHHSHGRIPTHTPKSLFTTIIETFTVPLAVTSTTLPISIPKATATSYNGSAVTATFTVPAGSVNVTILHTFSASTQVHSRSFISSAPLTRTGPLPSISVDTSLPTPTPVTQKHGPSTARIPTAPIPLVPGSLSPETPSLLEILSRTTTQSTRSMITASFTVTFPKAPKTALPSFSLPTLIPGPSNGHTGTRRSQITATYTLTLPPHTTHKATTTSIPPDTTCDITTTTIPPDTTCLTTATITKDTCTEETATEKPVSKSPVTLTYTLVTKATLTADIVPTSTPSTSSTSSAPITGDAVTLTYTLPGGPGYTSRIVTFTTKRPQPSTGSNGTAASSGILSTALSIAPPSSIRPTGTGAGSSVPLSSSLPGNSSSIFPAPTAASSAVSSFVSSSASSPAPSGGTLSSHAGNGTAVPHSSVSWFFSSALPSRTSSLPGTGATFVSTIGSSVNATGSTTSTTSPALPSASITIITLTTTFGRASSPSPMPVASSSVSRPLSLPTVNASVPVVSAILTINGTAGIVTISSTAFVTLTSFVTGEASATTSPENSSASATPTATVHAMPHSERAEPKSNVKNRLGHQHTRRGIVQKPDGMNLNYFHFTASYRQSDSTSGLEFSKGFQFLSSTENPHILSSSPYILQYQQPAFDSKLATLSLGADAMNACGGFSLVSWKLGCNSTTAPCEFNITGIRRGEKNSQGGRGYAVTASDVFVVAPISDPLGYSLSPVTVDPVVFANLTSLIVELSVGGDTGRTWWADGLRVKFSSSKDGICQPRTA